MTPLPPTLSYCVVNTNGREYLLACLAAIERTHPAGMEREILVLDNASEDGSAEAVRALGGEIRLIALERRTGKAENDSTLMREAQGELLPAAERGLRAAAGSRGGAGRRARRGPESGCRDRPAARLRRQPGPLRLALPGSRTAAIGALFLHRRFTVQSVGAETRRVDWAQSSALLVRREAAAAVGYMDPDFFVYYDECDFAKRLADAGWHSLFVPGAEAVHHDQLSTDLAKGLPRIVEFHRNRDLYMRKHHGPVAALAVRVLTAWSYALRALAATVLPNRPAKIFWAHARQALFPDRGESIRDRAGA